MIDLSKIQSAVRALRRTDPRVAAMREMIGRARAHAKGGERGEQGLRGLSGAQGVQGERGLRGMVGIKGATGDKGVQGDRGEQGMTWRGAYQSSRTYEVGDVVSHLGSAYICTATTNQSPPNGFGWELLVARGREGARGSTGADGVGGSGTIELINPSVSALTGEVASGSGLVPTMQIICPSGNIGLADSSLAQDAFPDGMLPESLDVLQLAGATTYRFRGFYHLSTGVVSHSTSMSFRTAGGLTITSCHWSTLTYTGSALPMTQTTTQATNYFGGVAGGAMNAANTNPTLIGRFDGVLRTNDGGTLTPQITFSVAPAGSNVMMQGSFLEFWAIGSNAMNSNGSAIV